MDEYDITKAFQRIEDELISSMIHNIDRHRAEENKKGYNWSMWQAEQLKSLEKYKRENQKKYRKEFTKINKEITKLIRTAKNKGGMEQEKAILQAIKKGYKVNGKNKSFQGKSETTAEFFKLNEQKLESLIKATTYDMKKAETAVLRMANDQYRKAIFNAQVYANTGAGTYEKAVDMATKDMLAAGLNCVQYANGARHTLSDYADMAIRTANKRAYLQGEGQKRQEWGISTVIINKRGNPCPKCFPFVGKIMIDDVWSGGKRTDGNYPLMSSAVAKGLYHPRCKDSHTTYFQGISSTTLDSIFTQKEIEEENKKEVRKQYAQRQYEKFNRLTKYSLDEENKNKYCLKAEKWNKIKNESDLGIFKKKIIADKEMGEDYYYMIKEKFSHGKDNAKRVFTKYVPFDSIKNARWEGTAYFDGEKISMNYYADLNNTRGSGATWFHEHGHMIDKLTENSSIKNKNFFKLLQKDYLYNISQKTYTEIEEELCDMKQHSAISDLFHGLSEEKINGCAIHPRRRDGSSYWNEISISQEAFAHMFECQFDKVRYKQMQKYFPSALKEFEKILKEL